MSLTTNTIGSDVDAFIDGAKVTTTAGNIALLATSTATVTADTLAIAVTSRFGAWPAVSDAKVFVNGHTQAYLGRLAEAVADAGRVTRHRDLERDRDRDRRRQQRLDRLRAGQRSPARSAINRTTAAWVGDGSRIHARDADLAATATDAATAPVTSSAIGLVSERRRPGPSPPTPAPSTRTSARPPAARARPAATPRSRSPAPGSR